MLKPPLPLVGNKFRWNRILKPLAMQLPSHAVVFDAFGGSFAVSRMIKDWRPDVTCIVNDCGMYYRARLEAVEDTNAILDEMRAHGARNIHDTYEKYAPDVEATLKDIAEKAKDRLTVLKNLYIAPNTIRAKCANANYDVSQCLDYCSDCVIVDEMLDGRKAHYYAMACDLVVIDPPYERISKSWIEGDYICQTEKAQSFCRGIIQSGCAYWLFESPGASLMSLAGEHGARFIEYDRKRNKNRAIEQMAVSPGFGVSDGHAPPVEPVCQHVQLSLPF